MENPDFSGRRKISPTEPIKLIHFMVVKASYDMRLKSAQEWGCTMHMLHKMSIQRHKDSSTFSFPLLHTLPFPIGCFGN